MIDVNNTGLRKVTLEDAELLLEWRNDLSTRNASHNTEKVSLEAHIDWLSRSLQSESRKLFIYNKCGVPSGTVRADFENSVWELSWTVSPSQRGKGIAKEMVLELSNIVGPNLRAEVKKGNIASVRVAKFLGMRLEKEKDGVLFFSNCSKSE